MGYYWVSSLDGATMCLLLFIPVALDMGRSESLGNADCGGGME